MSASSKPTEVPSVRELATLVKTLGATPTRYMPQGPDVTETFTKAALAPRPTPEWRKSPSRRRRTSPPAARPKKRDAPPLLTAAIEEGDDRLDAVPLLWYWQITNIASALHTIRETARMAGIDAHPLRYLPRPDDPAGSPVEPESAHITQLTHVLAEAEEMLTSARANTARLPQWNRKPGNLGP